MNSDDDSSVPVGRFAKPVPRSKTQVYSFKPGGAGGELVESASMEVAPATVAALAPTLPAMASASPSSTTLEIKNLIRMLIEKDVAAWLALPPGAQNVLLDDPGSVKLVDGGRVKTSMESNIPNIIYNNVELKFNGHEWILVTIHQSSLSKPHY